MYSNIKFDITDVDKSIRNLYVDLKLKSLIGENNENLIREEIEKIRDIDLLKIIEYLKQLIEIYINYQIEKALFEQKTKENSKNTSESDNANAMKIIENNDEAYENIIKTLEAEIRNHVKVQNELKIQNEDLIAKIYQYEDALSEMEQMQKKLDKYELQEIKKQYGENDKKENEISILKAENRILKTTIANYETQIQEMQKDFSLFKMESQELLEKHKLIIENLKIELKNYESGKIDNISHLSHNNEKILNNNFSNRSITKSNAKIFSEINKNSGAKCNNNLNSKESNYNKHNGNNGIYKISYNSINYNLTNQKTNGNNINNGSNENEKDINKLAQSTNSNPSSKQEIYKKIFEKLNTIKVEKQDSKQYFKNIKRTTSGAENTNLEYLVANKSETKEKLSYKDVNLYSNQKSNSKGDVSAKISPEQKISSKILSNINFNEKCPIDNLTFTNNAINARNIELFSPSKIQNKEKDYKNEFNQDCSNKKNSSMIGVVNRRISSSSNLSNIKNLSKDSFGEKIKFQNAGLQNHFNSSSKTKKLNFKNIKNFSSVKPASVTNHVG